MSGLRRMRRQLTSTRDALGARRAQVKAARRLAVWLGALSQEERDALVQRIRALGPIPASEPPLADAPRTQPEAQGATQAPEPMPTPCPEAAVAP
jgi:hypothetical protein